MNIKEFAKFNKAVLGFKNIGRIIASRWTRYYQAIFIIIFIFAAGLGLYFWYKSLYRSQWSDEEKNRHTATQSREINLKEEEFQKVLSEIEKRKKSFESDYQPVKDIFKPYEGFKKK